MTALLHDDQRTKVVHDFKSTLLALHQAGLVVRGHCIDTMIADYLLNPNRRDHQLETIALEILGTSASTGQDGGPAVTVRNRYRLARRRRRSRRRFGQPWPGHEPTPVGTGEPDAVQ